MFRALPGRSALTLTAAVGLMCTGVPALAFPLEPTPAVVRADHWSFTPIVDAASHEVHSFLALKDKSHAGGNNLVAVWYVRTGGTGEQWTSKTWETTNQWDAVKYVKAQLSIGDECDGVWETADRSEAELLAPVEYDKGLIAADPLNTALNDPATRDVWIDVLTDAGYKAADVKFDNGQAGTCDQTGWLNVMSQSVKQTLDGPVGVPSGADVMLSFADACAAANSSAAMAITLVSTWTAWNCEQNPSWQGTPDPVTGKCVYGKCKLCTSTRVVKTADGRCWKETQYTEWCCPNRFTCDKLPNGNCPNGNSGDCGANAPACTMPTDPSDASQNTPGNKWAYPTPPYRDPTPIPCPR